MHAPPPIVEIVTVIQQNVPITQEWIANLDGYVNVAMTPQVTGYLLRQDYREGSFLRKGTLMFEIDPRPFRAALEQAQAEQLQAEAQEGNSRRNVERDTPLAAARAIAQSQLDNDIQTNLANQAQVLASKAAVEQARINLGFTQIRAPVDGIAGITKVQSGNLVTPTTELTAISQINPIKAYIGISEQQYLTVAKSVNAFALTGRAIPQSRIPLRLILADGSEYPRTGQFLFSDLQVDQATGTMRIASVFPNPGNILRPGQFGRIRAVTSTVRNALLVPQRAVTQLQSMYQVAVVDSNDKVHIEPVTVGDRYGSMWVIESGLHPGDRVITEGTQKVAEGMLVSPKPASVVKEGN